MKKLCLLIGEVWLTVKVVNGLFTIGEKVGEAKAMYELGKTVSELGKDAKKEESK